MSKKDLVFTLKVKNKKVADLLNKIINDINNLDTKYKNLDSQKLDITVFKEEKALIINEINALKALITGDEETIKKIELILKQLENIEVDFLTRLQNIEDIQIIWYDNRAPKNIKLKDLKRLRFNFLNFNGKLDGTQLNMTIDTNIFAKVVDLNLKQDIIDNSLQTESKKIVEAINEVLNKIPKSKDLNTQYKYWDYLDQKINTVNNPKYLVNDIVYNGSYNNETLNITNFKEVIAPFTIKSDLGDNNPIVEFAYWGMLIKHPDSGQNRIYYYGINGDKLMLTADGFNFTFDFEKKIATYNGEEVATKKDIQELESRLKNGSK